MARALDARVCHHPVVSRMDSATAFGITVMLNVKRQRGLGPSCGHHLRFLQGVLFFLVLHAISVSAADRYAVIITGASGGDVYAQKYDRWRVSLAAILEDKFACSDHRLFLLAVTDHEGIANATRDNLTQPCGDFL